MRKLRYILLPMAVLMVNIATARAQQHATRMTDHLFSERGKSMVTVATGIPYIGIAEYAYGVSDRFSLGLIAGQTPKVTGYGLRVRAIIYQKNESFRLFVRAPVLYYPKTKGLGGEPWFLTWPVVGVEWRLNSGVRVSVGGGFVAAVCANALLGLKNGEHVHADGLPAGHDREDGKDSMGGLWNTFHVGIAVPVSKRIMFQSEVSVVMSGFRIAGNDWVGRLPVIATIGFSYSL